MDKGKQQKMKAITTGATWQSEGQVDPMKQRERDKTRGQRGQRGLLKPAALGLLGATLALTGCTAGGGGTDAGSAGNNSGKGAKGPVTVTMWMTPIAPEDVLKKLINDYNSSQQEVQVELTVLDFAKGREKIKTSLFAKDGPDLFYIGNGLDQSYIDANVMLPLDQAGFSKEELAKFSPLIQMNGVNGSILAAPVYYDAYLLYYRKDILKQYGFDSYPKTWEELKRTAAAITKQSGGAVMGYQHKGGDDHYNAINLTWQTFLGQTGGHFMDAKGTKSTMNTPEGRQALDYMKSFYAEGISQLGPSAVNGFREGKVAMFQFAQNVIDFDKYATDASMKGKWGVAPVPTGPKSGYSYAGGQGVAINAATAHKEAAGKALKWFIRPEHMPIWMQNGHGIPAYDLEKVDSAVKASVRAEIDKDKDNWEPILEQIKRNTPELMVEQRLAYTPRWEAQKNLLMAALGGKSTVEEALKALDAQVDQALK